jgi:hypothetical protein
MPKPPNAFKEYPRINDAYGYARKMIVPMLDEFNRSHPEGLGFWAKDLPVMNYVRSCIPKHLNPPELGTSTKDIQDRMRTMIYPLIETKLLSDREFADSISDRQRIESFMDSWFQTETPSMPRGKQPRHGLEDFVKAGLIAKGALIILRAYGKEYHGSISPNFGVKIDVGAGAKTFRSPNDVISKGLEADFGPWKCFWVKESSGKEILLEEIRNQFVELRDSQHTITQKP